MANNSNELGERILLFAGKSEQLRTAAKLPGLPYKEEVAGSNPASPTLKERLPQGEEPPEEGPLGLCVTISSESLVPKLSELRIAECRLPITNGLPLDLVASEENLSSIVTNSLQTTQESGVPPRG